MKRILCAALLCAAGSAMADLVAKDGSDVLRLTAKPCEAAYINPDVLDQYRVAYAVVGGKNYQACWTYLEKNNAALLLFDDGDYGLLPLAMLENDAGI